MRARTAGILEENVKTKEAPQSFWSARKYRSYRIGIMFLVLVLLTELVVRVYFLQDDVIERNPGNTPAAMNYLFEQMKQHEGRKVVFLGSSVVQGFGNCLPGTHFPALVEKMLHEKYGMTDVRCFNLSSAGNRFGDHFGNLIETMRYDPDLVVTAIHLKMFSVHSSLVDPFTHEEVIYYFRNDPDFSKDYRERFRISPVRYRQIWLDFQLRKVFALYRHRGILSYFWTGNYRRPTTAASDYIKAAMGWMNPLLIEAHTTDKHERNANYLWKVIPHHVIQLNYHHCEAFDLSAENINYQTFVDLSGYAQKNNVNMIYYLSPINRPFVEQREFFEWNEVVPLFKQRTLEVTRKHKIRLLDAVEKIDYRYFSDLDHLNMNGHRQMAEYMLPHLVRQLNKGKR